MSEAANTGLIKRVIDAFELTKDTTVRFEKLAEFGKLFGEWKIKTKQTPGKLKLPEQMKVDGFHFTLQWGNRHSQFAKVLEQFWIAHKWYQDEGLRDGWMTRSHAGVDYGLQVIALFNSFCSGKDPAAPAAAMALPSKTQQMDQLRHLLTDAQSKNAMLIDALGRVYALYRLTSEGADYHEALLSCLREGVANDNDTVDQQEVA